MTVVSTKEFNTYQEKYLELAMTEKVYIQRESDNIMFIITRDKRKYLEPDDDLRRAITIDELFDNVKGNIRKKYANQ